MVLKLAMIVLPPLMVTIVVLSLIGASWDVMARVTVVLVAFLLVIGLCDRMRQGQQLAAAESMAAAHPQESSALGLGASAIASLPVYKYEKKSGGGSDECSICLAEMKPMETVKQLPVCTHLFHEGCIDLWLWSHRTCPVCRSPVVVAVAPASVEIHVRHQDSS
ncbi:hypothetical protein BDA96_10G207100 [Sorghum bicolor]|jgi:hypothetical protein|uniref:RING-type E3 ubiquitin transferase n=2 Tax=Sorghum bicolor TaxID=4558 RepID=A0A1W0VTD4_SORBI|nr:E3 ubiquitin-protein ligase RING1 [Sorghum bicolor]KAG0514605.1 hypothetical protein BDA96_10G207100 [Sorghum bicolor]OQU76514.1 hypothetical protein SORBI_3010G158300 [Sorghum bicolor]|eukprot:XP_002437097.1 E3 ubiquitin-protein ligase RING1 [Sorghum bicolor]